MVSAITLEPSNGGVISNAGDINITFTPDADFHGGDSFVPPIRESTFPTSPAYTTATVITPLLVGPVAVGSAATTIEDEDEAVVARVLDNETTSMTVTASR
jgi:hypothetical protein